MPNLVTTAFFVRDINIPNIGMEAVDQRVNEYIDKYEKDCLLKLLGYQLYKAFRTETSQRMTDLTDGVEYTGLNYPYATQRKWDGLVHDDNHSLLAYYIYWHLVQDNAIQLTGVAAISGQTDLGQTVSPADKMIQAWNSFSSQAEELINYLYFSYNSNALTKRYPEYSSVNYYKAERFARKINIFGI